MTRMKSLLIGSLLFLSCFLRAQSESDARTALKTITSLDQLEGLKADHPDWYIRLEKTLTEAPHYDSLLFHADVGQILQIEYEASSVKYLHKILEKGQEEVCKVSYIYLNGTKHTKAEIKRLQDQIIAQYNSGTPFLDLVQKYTEDGNPTGELEWFYKGMMVEEFDQAVRAESAGKIFPLDIPEYKWYYVILKTEANKMLDCSYSVGIELAE